MFLTSIRSARPTTMVAGRRKDPSKLHRAKDKGTTCPEDQMEVVASSEGLGVFFFSIGAPRDGESTTLQTSMPVANQGYPTMAVHSEQGVVAEMVGSQVSMSDGQGLDHNEAVV